VYHLAALCHNNEVLREITSDYSEELTDLALDTVTDDNKRNILHYSILTRRHMTLNGPIEKYSTTDFSFFSQYINITAVDIFGNSVFHYLLKNGHVEVLLMLNKILKPSEINHLTLGLQNKDGLTAVEFTFRHATPGTYFVTMDSLAKL
jgi:ankyrin repeat protein